jgi:hypothetical protein
MDFHIDLYWFSSIYTDFHGFSWISMDFHRFIWISMDLNGFTWIFIDFHCFFHGFEREFAGRMHPNAFEWVALKEGFIWISIDSHRFILIFMDLHRFSWIFIDFYRFSSIYMDFHGFHWIYMDFHGFSWIWEKVCRPNASKCIRSVPLRDGARMLGARCHEARLLEARILGYWRLGYWRLGGYKACRPRLGGLALIGVIACWLVLVLGCVLTRSTLREVGGFQRSDVRCIPFEKCQQRMPS